MVGPLETGASSLAVEVDTLDKPQLQAVARNRDVVAIAPVVPMRLIEPEDVTNIQPAAAGVDWGVSAVGADTSPFTGDGVVVSVLDTGIDKSHAAFAGVNTIEKNFSGDANASDQNGHGTHCAGTIFGRDVNGVRIGVARDSLGLGEPDRTVSFGPSGVWRAPALR